MPINCRRTEQSIWTGVGLPTEADDDNRTTVPNDRRCNIIKYLADNVVERIVFSFYIL